MSVEIKSRISLWITLLFLTVILLTNFTRSHAIWEPIPPYNVMWPLWSSAYTPVNALVSVAAPLVSDFRTMDIYRPASPSGIYSSYKMVNAYREVYGTPGVSDPLLGSSINYGRYSQLVGSNFSRYNAGSYDLDQFDTSHSLLHPMSSRPQELTSGYFPFEPSPYLGKAMVLSAGVQSGHNANPFTNASQWNRAALPIAASWYSGYPGVGTAYPGRLWSAGAAVSQQQPYIDPNGPRTSSFYFGYADIP